MDRNSKPFIQESLEHGDLANLVHNELHIDEFKSKMGNDEDIVVLSFKVGGKEPANDLMGFIERGYEWVLDADVSAGEMDDGDYIVFVELERTPKCAEKIIKLVSDIENLTKLPVSSYRVRYYKSNKEHPLSLETLHKLVSKTPEEYLRRISKDNEELDKLRSRAGLEVKTQAPDNEFTESLKIAAGIL